MKKSFYLLGAVALTLAGCADDGLLENSVAGFTKSETGEITFSAANPNMTRTTLNGSDAADKLDNQFIVWGEKEADQDGSAVAAGRLAFKNYKVKYTAGTANTTESNTENWEYVGLTPYGAEQVAPATAKEQTIKYWDYSAANYVFTAFSARQTDLADGRITATKTENGTTKYDKGYTLKLSNGADLTGLYFADRKVITKESTVGSATNHYGNSVTLQFRSAVSKIRFALYETVPGYSVQITKAYYTNNDTDAEVTDNTSKFAINGGFSVIGASAAIMTVVYYDNSVTGLENQPKVTMTGTEACKSMVFGNGNMNVVLGTTSPEATYDNTGKSYTVILPNESNTTNMVLKVDYKLTSIDGSGEVINVTGATATIPAHFCQWKANYAYTYLFKISDNTNGSTGTSGTDPAGLYPITFDACVVDDAIAEQQTITTVADNPITTYQHGSQVDVNNEYTVLDPAKNIYVAIPGVDLDPTAATGNVKLYTAIDLGNDKEGITEKTVANWANNDIALTDITALLAASTTATTIPAAESTTGKDVVFANKIVYFAPAENQIYVVKYTNAGKDYYKVIKVGAAAGTAARTFVVATADEEAIVEGASKDITVKETIGGTEYNVLGLKSYLSASGFTFTETASGYKATSSTSTPEGNNTVTVTKTNANLTITTLDITVDKYAFAPTTKDIAAGSNDQTITLQNNSATATDINGTFTVTPGSSATGTVTASCAAGVVTLTASDDASGDFYVNYLSAECTVTVKPYTLTASPAIINGTGTTATITLSNDISGLVGDKLITVTATNNVVKDNPSTITTAAADGTALLEAGAASGTATMTYKGAEVKVEVTHFAIAGCGVDGTGVGSVPAAKANVTAGGTFYVKFTSDGTAKWADSLTGTNCTLTRTATTGVYKVTTTAADTATKITCNYKGQQFDLLSID